jgi:hypothetical protein
MDYGIITHRWFEYVDNRLLKLTSVTSTEYPIRISTAVQNFFLGI